MRKEVRYEGPDISVHNGTVNIKKIRDAGYKRIALRAGYGKNNTDQKFPENALACYNIGVKTMIYWFSYALNEAMAANEGKFAVEHAKKYFEKCPIAFDLEYDSINYARKNGVNITKTLATDMAIAFLKVVKDSGYIPVIYTNRDYLSRYFDMNKITTEIGTVYVWYARYVSNLSETEESISDVWQHTSSGRIPGVSGRVDLNRYFTEFSDKKIDYKPVTCNINILNFQKSANADGYRDQDGSKLKEDGIDGPKTQYIRKTIFLKAKRFGLTWRVGSEGELVAWYQMRCNEILGHNNKADGKYGKNTRKETMELQKKLGLDVDGIAGYNTIQSLFYN